TGPIGSCHFTCHASSSSSPSQMLLDSAPTAPAGTPAVAAHSAADRTSAIAACLALATVGFVTSMGMPMVVEALIDQYRYREGQAGYVASAEYLGMFAASVI